ncbi:hypothetical protein MNBD_GAMMA18-331 [hydrothermal vent metagenome]|uniref:Uncharacterized protein n=1 Tax=hydrothermal vent metagenome TaxID=652676 RepID=A0A3B0ZGD5_9ZZZZ
MLAEIALISPENCTNRATITAHFETDENNFRSA